MRQWTRASSTWMQYASGRRCSSRGSATTAARYSSPSCRHASRVPTRLASEYSKRSSVCQFTALSLFAVTALVSCVRSASSATTAASAILFIYLFNYYSTKREHGCLHAVAWPFVFPFWQRFCTSTRLFSCEILSIPYVLPIQLCSLTRACTCCYIALRYRCLIVLVKARSFHEESETTIYIRRIQFEPLGSIAPVLHYAPETRAGPGGIRSGIPSIHTG